MQYSFGGGLRLALVLALAPAACGGRPLDLEGTGGDTNGGGAASGEADQTTGDGEGDGEREGDESWDDAREPGEDDEWRGDRRDEERGASDGNREFRLAGTDRWVSSGFEDPFEALITFKSGEITGRVCGPSLWEVKSLLDGSNCGVITAGWTKGAGFIHFDFTLPWDRVGTPVTYSLVGSWDGVNLISAVMQDQGTITFTRCPADREGCRR